MPEAVTLTRHFMAAGWSAQGGGKIIHGACNHALRTERWRCIRYADGSEELYDRDADPHEWKNLADDPAFANVKREHAAQLPKTNTPDAPKRPAARPQAAPQAEQQ